MKAPNIPMLIGGKRCEGRTYFDDVDPFRNEVVARVPVASREDVDAAVAAARAACPEVGAMPSHRRSEVLLKASQLARDRKEELGRITARETGKALKDSIREAERTSETFLTCAEEAKRIAGFQVPLDAAPLGEGKYGFTIRVPVGVVVGIAPFNAPLNIMAHKVGPAFAAGNAMILKPGPQCPMIGKALGELLLEAGIPPGAISVLYGGADVGDWLVTHPDVDFISFTGSARTAEAIKARSGLKRLALELGGNAATIVHSDGNVSQAANACVQMGFRLAGQSCISVQRVYVQETVVDTFTQQMLSSLPTMKVGDPLDPSTDIGPMVDEAAARRVEEWLREAVDGGAKVLVGGTRRGPFVDPTVVTNLRPEMKLVCEEVFGPVVGILPYREFDDAIRAVNDSVYGLQAGVFTASLKLAFQAARDLQVGGVIINGTNSFRTDQMPYGGIKRSGIGREGPRYAIEDMTHLKLLVFNPQ